MKNGLRSVDINLDEKDKKIIFLLQENPFLSQNEISEKVNLSQPAVGARIKKLRKKGFLSYAVGINPKKIGLHFAKLDIETDDREHLLSSIKKCPYVMNIISMDGRRNLSIFLVSEDFSTLESVASRFIEHNSVENAHFNIILKSEQKIILPIQLVEKNKSPCNMGMRCEECRHYENGKCIGCPSSPCYKGKLW